MNNRTNHEVELPGGMTEAELQATIYFAVGVTSESGYDAYKLMVAGDRASTPLLEAADNSGYSIGTIQTDLGQHYQPRIPNGENVPRDLLSAYQGWAGINHPDWVITDPSVLQQTLDDLGRDGRTIKNRDHGRPLDASIKSKLDAFLTSSDGITWTHNRDIAQVAKIMNNAIPALQRSDVYLNSGKDDQIRLAAMVAKAYNQNERLCTNLLDGLRNNRYNNVDEVKAAVDGLNPRRSGAQDYLETGRDRALLGAEVVVALHNSRPENPLHTAWQNLIANPLVNPTRLDQDAGSPHLGAEYATVKTLFIHYDVARGFVEALDRGGTYQYGAVDKANPSHFKGVGFYASGNDFAAWNRDGNGHSLTGGVWSSLEREDLIRVANPDNTIDLNIIRDGIQTRLLHVDRHAPPLRADRRRSFNDSHDTLALPAPQPVAIDALLGNDPRNPEHRDHAFFELLQRNLPPGTSDEMVAHVLLEAKIGKVRGVGDVEQIMVHNDRVFVMSKTPGFRAAVDLAQAPPPMQDTVQRSDALDAERMQRQQWLAQEQQLSRNPSMSRSL